MDTIEGASTSIVLTKFPYLGSSANPLSGRDAEEFHERTFDIPKDCPAFTEEKLTLAWAYLLKNYGTSDVVFFKVNGIIVKVDFEASNVENITDDSDVENQNGTAVFVTSGGDSSEKSQFCTSLSFDDSRETLCLRVSSRLVPKDHIDNMVLQIQCLLSEEFSSISANMSFVQYQGARSILNPTPCKLSGKRFLHQVLENENSPFDVSLEFIDTDYSISSFSYRELDLLSTKMACQILDTPGESRASHRAIPVLLPKSPQLYIALFAILKSGKAFCPIPLDAPIERMLYICRDVNAPFLITTTEFGRQIEAEPSSPPLFLVSNEHLVIDQSQAIAEKLPLCEDKDLAYVMYTSGSTGVPKGVSISHGAIMQSLYAHQKHIAQFERFLQFANPTFDVFVFEFFFPLLRGATVVAVDRGLLLNNLPEVIVKSNVDALELTPTVLQTVILENKDALRNVKCLLTIGEMLTETIVKELGYDEDGFGGILQGMYGPTEAAVHCSIAPNVPKNGRPADIGIPLDTVSSFIVSPLKKDDDPKIDCEILPLGFTGELALGGHQLADEYLNRPKETAAAFVRHSEHGPLYRTGDRARFLSDGRIEILGRLNAGQVKLRGMRVELGEIEATIRKADGVHACVASVLRNGSQLVAFVSGDKQVTTETVRQVCEKWLPAPWRPHHVQIFEKIPKLASGKADRKRLEREWETENQELSKNNEDPATSQSQVMSVLKSVLGVPRTTIGTDSLLRHIGLDSIGAIKIAQLLRKAGGDVQVSQLMQPDMNVGDLEELFRRTKDRKSESSRQKSVDEDFANIRAEGLEFLSTKLDNEDFASILDVLPCTKIQAGMLAETCRDPTAYCNWVFLSVEKETSVEAVCSAIRDVVNSNEILRTGFLCTDTGANFVQLVWKEMRTTQLLVDGEVKKRFSYDVDKEMDPPVKFQVCCSDEKVQISLLIHHALYDGWSLENVIHDIAAAIEGKEIKKRPQYREVVRYFAASKLDTESLENSLSFWQDHLENSDPCQFPSLHSQTKTLSGTGRESIVLQKSSVDYISTAYELGVSPQTIAQAAWAYLLSQYTDSHEVIFGTVLSGRTLPISDIGEVVGPCLTTLPARVKLNSSTPLHQIIQDLHQHNISVLEHAELSLREIKQSCMSDMSRPIFDTIVVWQHTGQEPPSSVLNVDSEDCLEYAITIEVEPKNDMLEIRLTYLEERMPKSQAKLILRQLDELISHFVSCSMSNEPFRFDNMDDALLSVENPHPKSLLCDGSPQSLVSLVEAAVEKSNQSLAIEFSNGFRDQEPDLVTMSYDALNSHANKLGRYLLSIRKQNAPGLIAVCMEKSLSCYASILAVLKTGAGYLPLIPETPKERLRQILDAAGVEILLTTQDVSQEISSSLSESLNVVSVDVLDLSSFSSSNLNVHIEPSDVAYVIFTSGSTGTPKGVMVTHGNIVSNIRVLSEIYPRERESRLLQFCSIAFDVSVFEIFFTWASQMTLCSGTKDTLLSDLEGAIRTMGVTHLSLTNTVAALIDPDNVPNVRFFVMAGEKLTEKVFRTWSNRGFYQGYGPSETTNICTVNPDMNTSYIINNIGKPFVNTSAFAVDQHDKAFRILPKGCVGELCFGGDQVFKGYMNSPQLTSAKIIDHPQYGRIYRTGDIGRILSDGTIAFESRIDDQVKLRGQRIELGEINAALMLSHEVTNAITLVMNLEAGGVNISSVVSFVTLSGNPDAQSTNTVLCSLKAETEAVVQSLHNSLSGRLPHYMLPSIILPLTSIPMTSNSKVDARKLEDIFVQLDSETRHCCIRNASSDDSEHRNWTNLERDIAETIADLAHVSVSQISRNSSIYEFGLDSIKAIELSRRLSNLGHSALKVSQIMQHPTSAALAVILQQRDGKPSEKAVASQLDMFAGESVLSEATKELAIKKSRVASILPCTPLQEAMLSAKSLQGAAAYANHTVLRLNIDPQQLKRALKKLVDGQEILRSCFTTSSVPNHPFLQLVLKEHALPWMTFAIDEDQNILNAIHKYMESLELEPLSSDPPYNFALFENRSEQYLVVSMHHCLYDGYSMNLFWDDLETICNGRELPSREAFSSFLNYMLSVDMDKSLGFWAGYLKGYVARRFPSLTPVRLAGRVNSNRILAVKETSNMPLSSIERACSGLSVSLLACCQATWAKLLSSYVSRTDVCFGNVVSGRTVPVEGVETILGPCFNTIPVRAKFASDETNRSLFKKLHKLNVTAGSHQLTPLRKLMAMESLDLKGGPLFDTLLLLQPAYERNPAGLWNVVEEHGAMDVPVTIELTPNKELDRLDITIHFNNQLVSEDSAHTISQQFISILEGSLECPDGNVLDLSDAIESISTSSKPCEAGIALQSFESMLELPVKEYTQNHAIEYLPDASKSDKWTFEKMHQQSTRLAHLLLSKNLRPDAVIGISHNLGQIEFFTCILACLKAGHGFLLDEDIDGFSSIQQFSPDLIISNASVAMAVGENIIVVNNDLETLLEDMSLEGLDRHFTPDSAAVYYKKTGSPSLSSISFRELAKTLQSSKGTLQFDSNTRLLCTTGRDIFYFVLSWISGSCLCLTGVSYEVRIEDLKRTIEELKCTSVKVSQQTLSSLRPEMVPHVRQVLCEVDWLPESVIAPWIGKLWKVYTGFDGLPWTIGKMQRLEASNVLGNLIGDARVEMVSSNKRTPTLALGRLIKHGDKSVGGPAARVFSNGEIQLVDYDSPCSDNPQLFYGDINDACLAACSQLNFVWSGLISHHATSEDLLAVFVSFGVPAQCIQMEGAWDVQEWPSIEHNLQVVLRRFPDYSSKKIIVPVHTLPLDNKAILDRGAITDFFQNHNLKDLYQEEQLGDADYKELERNIASAFSEVSRVPVENIRSDSTIYELGLDSITTSQVAMILRRNSVEVNVIDILENPSVRKLAQHTKTRNIEGTAKHPGTDDLFAEYQQKVLNESGLESAGDQIQFIVPCTTTQEGMLSEFLRSTDGAYFNHVLYEVEKGVDIPKLVNAWTKMVSRTEVLRTFFFHLDDFKHPFAMIVHAEGSMPVPIHVEDMANDDQIQAYMKKETKALEDSFRKNLMQLPWKIVFFRGSENSHFLFSSHHVLYDAHSLELLMQDVTQLYNGNSPNVRPSILPLVTSILRSSTDTKALQTSRLYWDEQLANVKVSKFPVLSTIRSPYESVVSRSRSVSVSLMDIESSCKELGISLHALGQACWAKILGSYMGEDSVAFGLVLSGRHGFPTAEETLFPCLATLPSVANLTGNNLDLVRGIQRRTADAMRYQHTPLKLIQSWRGQQDQTLFDTIFLFQKSSRPIDSEAHWQVVNEDVSINYAVTVEMEISEKSDLVFRVNSRLSELPTEQSDILLGQLEACLVSIIKTPQAPSNDFTTISPELLSHTPPKEEIIPCDVELVHEFVERQAKLTPNKVALEFVSALTDEGATKETWTYARLNDEATRIANYLVSKNVQVDDIVAVCLDKCAAASVLFNGILKAGCGFLCLDYNSPVDRKALILSDSGAKFVFTDAVKAADLEGHVSVPLLQVDGFFDSIKFEPIDLQRKPDITPDSLCYCLYTSGTTGTPKGCEITHKNTVQAMLAFQRLFAGHWDENSRFLQFASFHFDVSVLEQFWSWSVGVCVTSAPRDLVFQDLAGTIRNLEITHLDLTPSLAALLNPEDCPSLCRGVFITGGEKLRRDILDKWGEKGCLYNGYGPTEVTIGCTMYPRVPITADPSNIGPQFDNVGSFVLQAGTDKVVPRGSVGELCAYGPLVGRGYLNRETLTTERFPTLKEFNIRIYRTGDLVRILHDGSFQFLGRADDQVKLRGQRLEISEINHTIKAASDKVKDVATLVLKHPKQHREQLVAFLACEAHHRDHKKRDPSLVNGPENKDLKDIAMHHCRSKLPPYMVPTHFLLLTHLPLSPNNKVDNKVLKAFYDNISLQDLNSTDGTGVESKWNAVEQSLREILCQMTDASPHDISKSSSIFEIGLDSVSVITFAKRLRANEFDVASPALIMQNPSIQLLSKVLKKDESQNIHNTREGELFIKSFSQRYAFQIKKHCQFQSSVIEEILPCSPLQEGMLTRSLASEGELYFNTFTLQLSQDTDVERLKRAWEVLIARTKVLRTCFVQTSNGFAQVVLKDFLPTWNSSFSDRDWSMSPPISFVIRKSGGQVSLSVRIFHALYDGASLSLILDEVASIYAGNDPSAYLQFSEALPSILSVDKMAAKAFWATHLSSKGHKSFPTLCDDPEEGYHTIERQLTSYSEIVKHSRRYKCTPLAIFQAAWAAILAKYIGKAVTFGLVVSGRALPIDGIDGCIGPLFNTIPCRMDVKEGDAFSDLIHQAHKFNCDSMPFQHTPLRDIHKLLGVEPGKSLFDTLLVFQHSSVQDATTLPWTSVDGESMPDYPIALEINHSGGEVCTITFVAQNSVLDRELSIDLVGEFESMVQSILKNDRQSCTSHIHTASDSGYHSPTTEGSPLLHDAVRGTFTWTKEAEVIRDILQHGFDINEDSIHEDDSLFQLGLDSIDMVNLSSKLRAKGIVVSVSELMKNPSIRKMINFIREKSQQSSSIKVEKSIELDNFEKTLTSNLKTKGVDMDNVEAVLPTTPLQEAMIAMCISSSNSLYFNNELLELDEHIDLVRLRKAWNEVVSTNPILRTRFLSLPSVGIHSKRDFVQIVQQHADVVWDEHRCLDANLRDYADKLAKQHRNVVDAQKQTPMIVSVIKSESKTILLFSISHALYDGYSLSLFFSDLQYAYYNTSLEHRRNYRDYLEKMLLADQENSVQFWADQLQSSSSAKFPRMSKAETDNNLHRTERLEHVSSVRPSDFKAFCRQSGVTEQVLGQTCWGLVLAQIHGQPDVAFGTVLACRDGEEEQNIMFPTMNTLPIRMIVHGTFRDLLRNTQENAANSMDHKFTALRDIQRVLKTGNGALFDTMFVYQKSAKADNNAAPPLWKSIDNSADLEFAVAVEMEMFDSNIMWRIAYGSLVDDNVAQTILTSLDSLLKQMSENPDMQSVSFDGNHYHFGGLPPFNAMRDDRLRYRDNLIDKSHIIDVIQNSSENIKACEVCVLDDRGMDVLVAFVAPSLEIEDKLSLLDKLKATSTEVLEHGSTPDYILFALDGEIGQSTARLQKRFNALSPQERASFSCQVASTPIDPGLEQKIREAIAEVSSLPENSIGNQQTIFHLGLDSISAIQLSSALRKRSVFLDVGQILREATVERMASAWTRLSSKKNPQPSTPSVDIQKMMDQTEIHQAIEKAAISRENIESVIPASPGQTYLLSAWQNSQGRLFYPTFVFKASRPLDIHRLSSAWDFTAKKHALLRSTFVATGQNDIPIVQVILKNKSLASFGFADASASSETEARLIEGHYEIEQRTSSRNKNRLARLFVLRTKESTVLFLTIHHALYDAVSLPILLSDIQSYYAGDFVETGTTDYHTPYLEYILSRNSTSAKEFWTSYLANQSPTLIVQESDRTVVSNSPVQASRFTAGAIKNASAIEKYSQAQGLSIHSVFLASYGKALADILNKQDVIFGVYVANRHLSEASRGWEALTMPWPALNFVPLLLKGAASLNVEELARRIQEDLVRINSGEYGHVGLWKIKEWTGIEVDCFFNFVMPQGQPGKRKIENPHEFALDEVVVERGHIHTMEDTIECPGLFANSQFLECNTAQAAVRTHLDVEMAIRKNAVDIGVFASGVSSATAQQVAELSDGICKMLKSLGFEANQ